MDIDVLKDYLRGQSFSVLCHGIDLGQGLEAVIIVKSSRDIAEGLREADAPVDLAWVVERTPDGPVVCLVLRSSAEDVGSLAGESYFDPSGDPDTALLHRLAAQARLRVLFLDEDHDPVWVTEVPWDEVRRLEAEQVLDRAEELLEAAPGYDFGRAKEIFQDRFSLDDLLKRVFPE